jgi:hypothetical protein
MIAMQPISIAQAKPRIATMHARSCIQDGPHLPWCAEVLKKVKTEHSHGTQPAMKVGNSINSIPDGNPAPVRTAAAGIGNNAEPPSRPLLSEPVGDHNTNLAARTCRAVGGVLVRGDSPFTD